MAEIASSAAAHTSDVSALASGLGDFRLPDPTAGLFALPADTIERWIRWFIILGIAARCIRYFLRFPLWEDECFLCYNYLDRDYLRLTGKLDFPPQVAPVFYLWSQLAIVRTLGFNEWTLRLTAFGASLLSVWLFARLARQFLSGVPRLFAVGLFSVSYVGIRYGSEAKPYGLDLFVSLLMITLAVNWLQSERRRDLLLLLAAVPIMLGFSFPAVFVGGGLVLFSAALLMRNAAPRQWLGLSALSAILLVSFGVVYAVNLRQKMAADLTSMQGYWTHSFPPLDRPWLVPFWLIKTHASDLTAYPAGGPMFTSSLSFIVWIVALVSLARRRQGTFLIFAVAPLGLTFIAAAMQKYPYGGHFKFNLYLAPSMCLVLGYGLALVAAVFVRRHSALGVVKTFAAGLAAVALVSSARDLVTPYKSLGDHHYRAFAQWFWPEHEHAAEVVCCTRDLHLDVNPETYEQLNFAAVYQCNQAIYAPRQRARGAIAWERVSADRPLVCVLYRDPWLPFDEAKLQSWLGDMSQTYRLDNRVSLPHFRKDHTGRHLVSAAYLDVFRFTPQTSSLARRFRVDSKDAVP